MKGYITFFKANISRQLTYYSPQQSNNDKDYPYYNKYFAKIRQVCGTSRLKCEYVLGVATLPRGVRWIKPCCNRKGS